MNDKLAFDMLVSKALNRQSPFEMAKSILESCIVADIVTKPAKPTIDRALNKTVNRALNKTVIARANNIKPSVPKAIAAKENVYVSLTECPTRAQ
jgi:hypothetical protein